MEVAYLASDFHRGSRVWPALHSSHMPQPGTPAPVSLCAFSPKHSSSISRVILDLFTQGHLYQKVFLLQPFEQVMPQQDLRFLFVIFSVKSLNTLWKYTLSSWQQAGQHWELAPQTFCICSSTSKRLARWGWPLLIVLNSLLFLKKKKKDEIFR